MLMSTGRRNVLGMEENMKRREFITLLCGAAAAWPFEASSPQAAIPAATAKDIARLNIEHYRRNLAEEMDPGARQ